MKKTIRIISIITMLIIALVTLTGCMNVNYEVKLNEDGSAEISYLLGYDKSFLSSMGVSTEDLKNDETIANMQETVKNEGYTAEQYEDDNTYGFKAVKKVNNIGEFAIEEALLEEGKKAEDSNKISYEKKGLITKYAQNAKVDLTTMLEYESEESAAMINAMMKQMKMTYKITLPFKAGDNNATTVSEDGKTLEWTLKPGEVNEIKFEATKNPIPTYVVIGVAVVVLVIVVILILNRNKKAPSEIKEEEPVKAPEEQKQEEVVEEQKQEENKEENE